MTDRTNRSGQPSKTCQQMTLPSRFHDPRCPVPITAADRVVVLNLLVPLLRRARNPRRERTPERASPLQPRDPLDTTSRAFPLPRYDEHRVARRPLFEDTPNILNRRDNSTAPRTRAYSSTGSARTNAGSDIKPGRHGIPPEPSGQDQDQKRHTSGIPGLTA